MKGLYSVDTQAHIHYSILTVMGRRTTDCLPESPANGSVILAGRAINLSAISRATGITKSFLSRIISGSRQTNINNYRKIAAILGWGLEDLIDAIDLRKKELIEERARIVEQYHSRIAQEDSEDQKAIKAGRSPIPRLPGLRV